MNATDEQLARFRELVARRLGLWFEDQRRDYLLSALAECVALYGDVEACLRRLETPGEKDAWQNLVRLLTVPETYFLRGSDHFRALVETVIPDRLRHGNGQRPLRILSAGCASGEEAYSLAICLEENSRGPGGPAVEIIGVDLNRAMLAKARSGRYSAWSLRETPAAIREKYFTPERGEFVLDRRIVAQVTFQERNLSEANDDLWLPGSFDAVFCRNMLMYFHPAIAAIVVARIRRALVPGGYLFLGHAESLRALSREFQLRRTGDAFYYQAPEGPVARQPEPATAASPTPGSGAVMLPEPTTNWVDEIERASARIASLAALVKPPAPARAAAPAGAPNAVGRALDLLHEERFTDALACLESLPASAPADLSLLQAMLLVHCGRLAEAEARCAPLLGRVPANPGAHYVTALCREQAGDLAAAAEHNQAAINLDPTFAMPRFHLGLLGKRLGQRGARGHFEAARTLMAKEKPERLVLFGGGFSREALIQACRREAERLKGAA